jgi:hypothetical protein
MLQDLLALSNGSGGKISITTSLSKEDGVLLDNK